MISALQALKTLVADIESIGTNTHLIAYQDAKRVIEKIEQDQAAQADTQTRLPVVTLKPEAVLEPTSFLLMCAWEGQSQLVSVRAGSVEAAIAKTKTWADPPKRAYHYPMPAAEPSDATSIAATAELGGGLAQLARSIDVVVTERDALRAVLEEIVHEFDNSYDADGDSTGRWTAAASIPVAVMLRAQRVLAVRS